jgi:hypothetical protein
MARSEERDDTDVDDIDLRLRDRHHVWLQVYYGYCKHCSCSLPPKRVVESTLRRVITQECPRAFFEMPMVLQVEARKLDYTEKKGWHDPRRGD